MNNLFVNQDSSSEILVSEEQSTQDLLYNGDNSEDILAPVQYEEYGLFAEQDNLHYMPLATKTTYGIVKIGDGLEVINGVLNVVGGGGGGSSNITKLSQLENDVGFITDENVVTLTDAQIVSGIKIFTETIGLLNIDGTLDRIRHINNNFLIVDQNGTALLDIDEGFMTIKSFGKELAFVEDIPNLSDVPTKVSDLINDVGFITNTVDNLVNYYLKTEQYTKEEINELVSNIPKFDIEVVDDPNNIPEEERSETTIYLVPRTDEELNDYYDEYLYINNTWERLGSTKINLSNYYTKADADELFLSKNDANSTFAKINDIPDVSNLVTTNTEQTITGVKTIAGDLKDKDGNLLLYQNNDGIYVGTGIKHYVIKSIDRPTINMQFGSRNMAFLEEVVDIENDQTIDGAKNFLGVLQKNGYSVLAIKETGNTYVQFDNGLIIQWANMNVSGDKSYSWEKPFSTSTSYRITTTTLGASSGATATVSIRNQVYAKTATGFSVYNSNFASGGCDYIAIGY